MNSIQNYGLSNYQSSCHSNPNFKAKLASHIENKIIIEKGTEALKNLKKNFKAKVPPYVEAKIIKEKGTMALNKLKKKLAKYPDDVIITDIYKAPDCRFKGLDNMKLSHSNKIYEVEVHYEGLVAKVPVASLKKSYYDIINYILEPPVIKGKTPRKVAKGVSSRLSKVLSYCFKLS